MGFGIGNTVITTTQKIVGLRIGNTVVKAKATLWLDGKVIGNIVVEAGAALILDGLLIGNLIDKGGEITINGSVIGNTIRTEPNPPETTGSPSNAATRPGRLKALSFLRR